MDPADIVRALASMMNNDSSRGGPIIEDLDNVKPPARPSRAYIDSRSYRLDMGDVMEYMFIGVLAMLFIVLLKIANRLR